MGTQQVSIWVPLVVGVIGLLGVIAGQLINAWREDHRWKRKIEQEYSDRRDTRKFDLYAEMVTALYKWCGINRRISALDGEAEYDRESIHSELLNISIDIDAIIGRLRLVASDDVLKAALAAWTYIREQLDIFGNENVHNSQREPYKSGMSGIDYLIDNIDKAADEFAVVARREFEA